MYRKIHNVYCSFTVETIGELLFLTAPDYNFFSYSMSELHSLLIKHAFRSLYATQDWISIPPLFFIPIYDIIFNPRRGIKSMKYYAPRELIDPMSRGQKYGAYNIGCRIGKKRQAYWIQWLSPSAYFINMIKINHSKNVLINSFGPLLSTTFQSVSLGFCSRARFSFVVVVDVVVVVVVVCGASRCGRSDIVDVEQWQFISAFQLCMCVCEQYIDTCGDGVCVGEHHNFIRYRLSIFICYPIRKQLPAVLFSFILSINNSFCICTAIIHARTLYVCMYGNCGWSIIAYLGSVSVMYIFGGS